MIVDTSAIIAIFMNEPEGERFLNCILSADKPMMSTASYLEICLIVDRAVNDIGRSAFDDFFSALHLAIIPVTLTQTHLARRAYQLYGKGSGQMAKLNFGDCFSYALAKETGQPLLFKGNDFLHTDIGCV